MTPSRTPEQPGGKVGEEPAVEAEPKQPTAKTMRELERLQFDALDRAGFDRR